MRTMNSHCFDLEQYGVFFVKCCIHSDEMNIWPLWLLLTTHKICTWYFAMVLSHEYKIFILGQKSDHFLTIILVLVFVLEETVIFEQLLQVQLYQYTVTFWGVSLYPIHLTSKLLSKQIIKDLDVHLPTMISLNSSEAFTMYLCVMIQTGTVYTCWNIILYNVCPFNRWLSYNTAVISSHDHHTWSNAHGHQLLEEELAGVWNTDLGDLQ